MPPIPKFIIPSQHKFCRNLKGVASHLMMSYPTLVEWYEKGFIRPTASGYWSTKGVLKAAIDRAKLAQSSNPYGPQDNGIDINDEMTAATLLDENGEMIDVGSESGSNEGNSAPGRANQMLAGGVDPLAPIRKFGDKSRWQEECFRIRSEILALQRDKMKGGLVDINEVREANVAKITVLKSSLLSMGKELAPMIAECVDTRQMELLITRGIKDRIRKYYENAEQEKDEDD